MALARAIEAKANSTRILRVKSEDINAERASFIRINSLAVLLKLIAGTGGTRRDPEEGNSVETPAG